MATRFTDTPITLTGVAKLCSESATSEKGYTTPDAIIAFYGFNNFTALRTTSAPNATIPVVSLAATGAETNIDIALIPKGIGGISVNIPNSLSSGGNKRGSRAMDFQTGRSSATQVASGAAASIPGGFNNTASGDYSMAFGYENSATNSRSVAIGGGGPATGNTASGTQSSIIGGQSNTSSGTRSSIIGGSTNSSSSSDSIVTGGTNNVANGSSSRVGGNYATARSLSSVDAFASSRFVSTGDCQRTDFILMRQTTNDTITELSINGSTPVSTTRIVLPDQHAYKFRGQAIAREAATGDVKSWDISGTIKRGAGAATTAIVGSTTVTVKDEDAGAAAWTLAIDADTTNGSLRAQVTGEVSHTIRWALHIETIEIS